jgi:hypothetical protein
MRYFNNLCVTILLSMLAISAPLLSVGVMRRTAIQELTKAINAHTISPVEARKKALSFKLIGSDLNDAVVKELIVTADSNGIQDILNPVKPEKALQKQAKLTEAPKVQIQAMPVIEPIPNLAVKKAYYDLTIFGKSFNNFKPGDDYNANMRQLRLFDAELNRIRAIAVEASKTKLVESDQKMVDEMLQSLFPALSQKLQSIQGEVELIQQKKEADAKATIKKPSPLEPALNPTKFTPITPNDLASGKNIIPKNISDLINLYVGKGYTVEEIIALRKKNQMAQATSARGIEAWLDPYAERNTKEELNEYVQTYVMPIATNARIWDKQSLIDQYYYISLAKPYFKKFKDSKGLISISQLLMSLLGQNSNETTLVIDAITDKTPIKNKYFVEIIDEFESSSAKPTADGAQTPTQGSSTPRSNKSSEKDESDYFRDPHEDETRMEKEESMSGASSRIKD